jgi:hypothetical protein
MVVFQRLFTFLKLAVSFKSYVRNKWCLSLPEPAILYLGVRLETIGSPSGSRAGIYRTSYDHNMSRGALSLSDQDIFSSAILSLKHLHFKIDHQIINYDLVKTAQVTNP